MVFFLDHVDFVELFYVKLLIREYLCINQDCSKQPSMPTYNVVFHIWRRPVSFFFFFPVGWHGTLPQECLEAVVTALHIAAVMSALTSPPPPSTGGPSGPAYGSLQDAICRQVEEPSQTTHCHGSGDDDDDVLASPEGKGMELVVFRDWGIIPKYQKITEFLWGGVYRIIFWSVGCITFIAACPCVVQFGYVFMKGNEYFV